MNKITKVIFLVTALIISLGFYLFICLSSI